MLHIIFYTHLHRKYFIFNILFIYFYLQEHFPVIYSYLLAIKIGNVPFLNHDDIKSCIENILSQNHFIELIKSQFPDILLKCIQMVVINTEEPILPIQINSDQFKNIINYFQVNRFYYTFILRH